MVEYFLATGYTQLKKINRKRDSRPFFLAMKDNYKIKRAYPEEVVMEECEICKAYRVIYDINCKRRVCLWCGKDQSKALTDTEDVLN